MQVPRISPTVLMLKALLKYGEKKGLYKNFHLWLRGGGCYDPILSSAPHSPGQCSAVANIPSKSAPSSNISEKLLS